MPCRSTGESSGKKKAIMQTFVGICVASALISPAMAADNYNAGNLAELCESKSAGLPSSCMVYSLHCPQV